MQDVAMYLLNHYTKGLWALHTGSELFTQRSRDSFSRYTATKVISHSLLGNMKPATNIISNRCITERHNSYSRLLLLLIRTRR